MSVPLILPLALYASRWFNAPAAPTLAALRGRRAGEIALHHFGPIDDLALGVAIGQLMAAARP